MDAVGFPCGFLEDTLEKSGHPGGVGVMPVPAARQRCLLMSLGNEGAWKGRQQEGEGRLTFSDESPIPRAAKGLADKGGLPP